MNKRKLWRNWKKYLRKLKRKLMIFTTSMSPWFKSMNNGKDFPFRSFRSFRKAHLRKSWDSYLSIRLKRKTTSSFKGKIWSTKSRHRKIASSTRLKLCSQILTWRLMIKYFSLQMVLWRSLTSLQKFLKWKSLNRIIQVQISSKAQF